MAASTNTRFAVAVHVLTFLAGVAAGRKVSSEELSVSTRTNPVHVRRVLGPLREAGLVTSRPGVRGGWELGMDPSAIALSQVWKIFQDDNHIINVHAADPTCEIGRGVQDSLVALNSVVSASVVDTLAHVTVADVLAGVPGTHTLVDERRGVRDVREVLRSSTSEAGRTGRKPTSTAAASAGRERPAATS